MGYGRYVLFFSPGVGDYIDWFIVTLSGFLMLSAMEREIRNAVITNADLDIERVFTYWIDLHYAEGDQRFGGYFLGGAFGCEAIINLLEVVGVTKWSELKGKPVRADSDSSKVYRLGHFLEYDWLDLEALSKTHFDSKPKD